MLKKPKKKQKTSFGLLESAIQLQKKELLSTKKEGNEKEIRDLLIQMIETDITNDSDLYRFGTKTADEIECTISDDDGTAIELHGYTVYKDYHIDYTARLFDAI